MYGELRPQARRSSCKGWCSLLKRGCLNLSSYPGSYAGIDLDNLRELLASWDKALANDGHMPPMPLVEFK